MNLGELFSTRAGDLINPDGLRITVDHADLIGDAVEIATDIGVLKGELKAAKEEIERLTAHNAQLLASLETLAKNPIFAMNSGPYDSHTGIRKVYSGLV